MLGHIHPNGTSENQWYDSKVRHCLAMLGGKNVVSCELQRHIRCGGYHALLRVLTTMLQGFGNSSHSVAAFPSFTLELDSKRYQCGVSGSAAYAWIALNNPSTAQSLIRVDSAGLWLD